MVVDQPDSQPLEVRAGAIRFENISFHYGQKVGAGTARPGGIIHNLSLDIAPGEKVGLVGRSGAGKSTLVNLLLRFYDLEAGRITIDGQDIAHVTQDSLRAQIGMVTQDTVLFDDTVAANIAYGSPGASKERIEAAARAAHAHEFVATLPEGYETRIGERGQRLSGGQRQRLAIARALLKDPPILVLDEATSSLDAESEHLVQDALLRLMENRTSFVIAHRLSTVRRADAIIVLERGVVREVGRHDELLARPNGIYARLYSLQMFENGAAAPGAIPGAAPAAAATPHASTSLP
jgi:ABC-type multidrug transport system fused ATPase/permease subunit